MPAVYYDAATKTIVGAMESKLKSILSGDVGGGEKIAAQLGSVDLNSHLIVVGLLEDHKANIDAWLEAAKKNLPSDAKSLLAIAGNLKGFVLTANLGDKKLASVRLDAYDDKGAAELNKAVEATIALGKDYYSDAKADGMITGDLPPGVSKQMLDITDALMASLKHSKDGARVNVTITAPDALVKPKRGAGFSDEE